MAEGDLGTLLEPLSEEELRKLSEVPILQYGTGTSSTLGLPTKPEGFRDGGLPSPFFEAVNYMLNTSNIPYLRYDSFVPSQNVEDRRSPIERALDDDFQRRLNEPLKTRDERPRKTKEVR